MFEILLLSLLTWLAYFAVINGGYVSDDIEGLQNYSGKMKAFDYGNLNKWILYKLFGKSPKANHFFSILMHNANVVLLYIFLATIVNPTIALIASALFAVHPITVQAVGWMSGRGYPIGLFFTLLSFFIANMAPKIAITQTDFIQLALCLIGYAVVYYIAIQAQFAALSTFAIQLLLGNYLFAIVGMVITAGTGFGIIKEVISHRTSTFKEQNLERSTRFHFKKIIVAMKTLGYYTRLCVFPKRMGLYHTFEYHYTDKTEMEDKNFWFGFILATALIIGFIYGNLPIKLGILWFIGYIFIFLNWITIHQFVSERYLYIASIGICLILATISQYIPYSSIIIFSMYLVRTWVHLPTYKDEISFYQSNVWNFPDSEVAFSNLGVTYMRCGLIGSAIDMWLIALNINKDYDVAHYNISSIMKQRVDLAKARESLAKAIASPMCHFKDVWSKELANLDSEIAFAQEHQNIYNKLIEARNDPIKKDQATGLIKQLEEIMTLPKKIEDSKNTQISLLVQEENKIKQQLVSIDRQKNDLNKPLMADALIGIRNQNFDIVRQATLRLVGT